MGGAIEGNMSFQEKCIELSDKHFEYAKRLQLNLHYFEDNSPKLPIPDVSIRLEYCYGRCYGRSVTVQFTAH